MATVADAKNALAFQTEQKTNTLAKFIKDMRPELAKVLPNQMNPDRMARLATTLMRQTPRLADCTPASFLGALMTCAQLGLEPGPLGHVWIIPRERRDKSQPTGVWEANFQLGYKGVIVLARRSGELAKIGARTVYEREYDSDMFTVVYDGADEHVTHKPLLVGERGVPVLYYAFARLTSGEQIFTPLRPEEVETRHRRRPQSIPNSPAWINDYQAMAWKSCVVEMRRWLPQSIELEQGLAQDGRTRTDISPDVLDTPAPDPSMLDGEVVDGPSDSGAGSGSRSENSSGGADWPEVAKIPASDPVDKASSKVDGE